MLTPSVASSPYPFPDLTSHVDLPARNGKPGLTTLYIAENHPQVPKSCRPARSYVLVWDTRPSVMERIFKRVVGERAPHWSVELKSIGACFSYYFVQSTVVYYGRLLAVPLLPNDVRGLLRAACGLSPYLSFFLRLRVLTTW